MYHDRDARTVARLEADLLRDERALIAEGQRLVLHRGRELIGMSGRVAGPAGSREAEQFVDVVLWSRCSPDGWPIGDMIGRFRIPADLSPGERALNGELLRSLFRLARSAGDLRDLRLRLAERGVEEHPRPG